MSLPNDIKPPPPTNHVRPNWHPDLFDPPFTALIIAPRKSGKTTLLSNLMERLLVDYRGPKGQRDYFEHIVLVSPTALIDNSAEGLRKKCDKIYDKYSDAIIDDLIATSTELERQYPILLILDDILGILPRHSTLSHFCTRNRHFNISVIITSQHFRAINNVIREKVCALLVFKISNEMEMKALSQELIHFDQAYDLAVTKGEPYSFLYVKVEGGNMSYFQKFNRLLFKV